MGKHPPPKHKQTSLDQVNYMLMFMEDPTHFAIVEGLPHDMPPRDGRTLKKIDGFKRMAAFVNEKCGVDPNDLQAWDSYMAKNRYSTLRKKYIQAVRELDRARAEAKTAPDVLTNVQERIILEMPYFDRLDALYRGRGVTPASRSGLLLGRNAIMSSTTSMSSPSASPPPEVPSTAYARVQLPSAMANLSTTTAQNPSHASMQLPEDSNGNSHSSHAAQTTTTRQLRPRAPTSPHQLDARSNARLAPAPSTNSESHVTVPVRITRSAAAQLANNSTPTSSAGPSSSLPSMTQGMTWSHIEDFGAVAAAAAAAASAGVNGRSAEQNPSSSATSAFPSPSTSSDTLQPSLRGHSSDFFTHAASQLHGLSASHLNSRPQLAPKPTNASPSLPAGQVNTTMEHDPSLLPTSSSAISTAPPTSAPTTAGPRRPASGGGTRGRPRKVPPPPGQEPPVRPAVRMDAPASSWTRVIAAVHAAKYASAAAKASGGTPLASTPGSASGELASSTSPTPAVSRPEATVNGFPQPPPPPPTTSSAPPAPAKMAIPRIPQPPPPGPRRIAPAGPVLMEIGSVPSGGAVAADASRAAPSIVPKATSAESPFTTFPNTLGAHTTGRAGDVTTVGSSTTDTPFMSMMDGTDDDLDETTLLSPPLPPAHPTLHHLQQPQAGGAGGASRSPMEWEYLKRRLEFEDRVDSRKLKLEEKRLELEKEIKEKEVRAHLVKDLLTQGRSLGEIKEILSELFA
ncbi:hypothetical protein HDU96_001615 [Phlyctochytrium bullatum]|nr:hypothetical protein HDU96_001615 [Phlyctochytrium bullatum]